MAVDATRRGVFWGLLLIVPASLTVSADADLWWHLLAGRRILETGQLPRVDEWSYVAAGSPWTDHEWVFQVITAILFDEVGPLGLLGFRAVLLTILILAWLATLRERLSSNVLCWVLAGVPLSMVVILSNARPQTLTWMLVPVVLWLIDRVAAGRDLAVWALAATVLLWVNLHAGFLFGWGVAGLGLLLTAAGLEGAMPSRAQRLQRLSAAALLLIFPVVNAYGLDLPHFIWREMNASHPTLMEWNPPIPVLRVVIAVAAATPVLVWLVHRGRVRPTSWVALLVATFAAMQVAKFIVLVLILSSVCLADALGPLLQRRLDGHDGPALRAVLTSTWTRVIVLALLLGLHLPSMKGPPGSVTVDSGRYPAEAVAWLAATNSGGRLAVPLGWGGIALYHLWPAWTVSMDGRNTTVFDVAEVDAQTHALVAGDPEPFLVGNPDAFLIPSDGALDEALHEVPGWARRFAGRTGVVWMRRGHGFSEPAMAPAPSGMFP
jgi:hypothetical protein